MNTIYRVVKNVSTGKWVVASELAKGRKKKTTLGAAIATALVLGLSMGGNAAMAAGTGAAGASCTTESGQSGSFDASGTCTADSIGARSVGTRSIGTTAALDDTYIKVVGSNEYPAANSTGGGSIAVGSGATSNGVGATSVGGSTTASADYTVALGGASQAGNGASATATSAIAIGTSAKSAGQQSITIGRNASTGSSAVSSVALGYGASATAANAVALGDSSVADQDNTVSVGSSTSQRKIVNLAAGTLSATSTDAVNGSQLYGMGSSVATALGGGSVLNPDGTISAPSYTVQGKTSSNIGDALTALDGGLTTAQGDITNINGDITNIHSTLDGLSGSVGLVQQTGGSTSDITIGGNTGGSNVNFAGTSGARVLTGLANGTGDTDAVTIAQLKAVGLIDPIGDPLAALTYDDLSLSSATLGGTNGTVINNLANGLIASGSMQAVNGGQLFDMQQNFQNQFNALNGQVGNLNDRVGAIESGIADGSIGGGSGGDWSGSGENSTQVGDGAVASGSNSTATGSNAVASGNNSTANGAGAVASGNGSTAVGQGAVASGQNSTALGSNSKATADNSVALGSGSVADRENTVSVGSEGNERQITNVAAGTAPTDAVNVGQLQSAIGGVQDWANQKFEQVNRRINGMGAMSAAYGQMAFSAQGINTPNKVGVGVGTQNGQGAIAVGYSRQIKPNMNISFGGAASANDASVGAGLSVGW